MDCAVTCWAYIAIDETRIFIRLAERVTFDLRIDVAVDLHDVGPAVVVVIEESAAPRDVLIVDADAGSESDVGERAVDRCRCTRNRRARRRL